MTDEQQPQKVDIKVSSGSSYGWIAGAVAALLALIGIAIAAYKLWSAGRAKAKAEHELAVLKEQQHQAEVKALDAADDKEAQENLAQVAAIKEDIAAAEDALATAEESKSSALARIDELMSWDDVDSSVRRVDRGEDK